MLHEIDKEKLRVVKHEGFFEKKKMLESTQNS